MQEASLVQTLSAVGTTSVGQGNSPSALSELTLGNEFFSQLLNGFGTSGDGQSGQQQPGRGQILPPPAMAALAAQGLDVPDTLPAAVNQELVITPEDAQAMLGRLQMLADQQGGHGHKPEVFAALEKQLRVVVDQQEPKTLAEIVAASPELEDVKVGPLVSGLIQLTRRVFHKDETTAQEDTPGQLLSTMQQWPAMMFRPDHAARAGAAPAATPAKKKERDVVAEAVTVVQPLAMHMAVPVEEVAEAPLSTVPTLDERIPPMTAPVESKKAETPVDLPDVSLPVMNNPVQATAEKAEQANSAEKDDTQVSALAAMDGVATSEISYPSATHGTVSHAHAAASKILDLVPTPGFVNHAPVKEQVHVAVTQAMKDGLDQITLQLEPMELGRVEVRFQTSREGMTQIYFLVDKPETFDSLSRDARLLERSLQEAGIKADTGSMQFNLRQQPQPQMQSDLGGQGGRSSQHSDTEDDAPAQHSALGGIEALASLTRHYTVNIRDGVDISA